MNQNSIIVAVLFTFGLNIFSFGSIKMHNLNCAIDEFGDDEGYQVSITHHAAHTKAILYVIDPGGQHILGKYKVIYHPADSKKTDPTASYKGLNFELKLHLNLKPRPDGLISASLRAVSQVDSFKIEEALLCRKNNQSE